MEGRDLGLPEIRIVGNNGTARHCTSAVHAWGALKNGAPPLWARYFGASRLVAPYPSGARYLPGWSAAQLHRAASAQTMYLRGRTPSTFCPVGRYLRRCERAQATCFARCRPPSCPDSEAVNGATPPPGNFSDDSYSVSASSLAPSLARLALSLLPSLRLPTLRVPRVSSASTTEQILSIRLINRRLRRRQHARRTTHDSRPSTHDSLRQPTHPPPVELRDVNCLRLISS